MAYNWKKHVKPRKENSEFVPYVLNTNTNTIFEFGENPHYLSSDDGTKDRNGIKIARSKKQTRKRQYVKVKSDGELDYNKTQSCQGVSKWLHQEYCIPCRNLNQAVYEQTLIRIDKTTDLNQKDEWRKIAEDLQNKYPEDLI